VTELAAAAGVGVAENPQAVAAALFDAHYVSLCRLAALLVSDRALAEEIVMEAFTRTLGGWRRIRDYDAAPAYLRRAVVNLARSSLSRRRLERRVNALSVARTPPASEDVPRDPAVAAAVAALPPRQRAAVVLRYYADLSEAEIAAALGCAPGTVKSQLSKARTTLAARLSEETP
jgi:RNA polymerase sigma-70 factor (sigma-E family)